MVLVQGWSSFFPERVAPRRQELAAALRSRLEGHLVPALLARERWAAPAGAGLPGNPPARGAHPGGMGSSRAPADGPAAPRHAAAGPGPLDARHLRSRRRRARGALLR